MRITKNFVFFYTTADHFSNFHPSVFKLNGVEFSCTEQYIMYSKAKVFGDEEIAKKILEATEPGKMKAFGRKVANFDDEAWRKQYRDKILFDGLLAKYTQNADLKQALLSTHPKGLVEASPSDRIYGVGLAENNPLIDDPANWRGENLLGVTLEKVRNEILDNKL